MSKTVAQQDAFAERAADTATAKAMAERMLAAARAAGADAAQTNVSLSRALTVTVRNDAVESLEFQRDRDLSLTVYCGAACGSAGTADWSDEGLRRAAEAAVAIARASGDDPCNGLPDRDRLAPPEAHRNLDLFHPWIEDADDAIAVARACEAAAMGVDTRIRQSEGATVDTGRGVHVLANSAGFLGVTDGSRHSLSCAVIAAADDEMQRDYWYSAGRVPQRLLSPEAVGQRAGERAVARLGARKIGTRQCPVLFPRELARGLWGALCSAASGASLYRRASFLVDRQGTRIGAPLLHMQQQPHIAQGAASASFDEEGVETSDLVLLADGVLQSYLLSSYSGRRLGLPTTGNAGGVFNLQVRPSVDADLDGLMRDMGEGLLVTELMGQGVNPVTGDYSRGAAGFWVHNGAIAEPVEEITIAGNLLDMLQGVAAIGSDVDDSGAIHSGAVLIGQMTVAGD